MSEQEKVLKIEFSINGNGIEFAINENPGGWFIGPNGKSDFTKSLTTFFENNQTPEFSQFLTIYNHYRNTTGVRGFVTGIPDKTKAAYNTASQLASKIHMPSMPSMPSMSSLSFGRKSVPIDNDSGVSKESADEMKGLLGGKKSKSKRPYNANKTLKNRK